MKNENRKFDVGSRVQVKPAVSIVQSLDPMNKTDGCLFMEQMWDLCDQKFEVLQVVENFFDKPRSSVFASKSNLYILDGVTCDGTVEYYNHPCDKTCFLFWHENWLSAAEE
ncbi:hypothetical protein JXA02_02960 [candidate division KSB1 bacterium]|nr:hypothetical protein [candidate division KSB1 bacterium]RQW09980.1 MAG: hypothetical protein EH222_03245 [candidate division KSB1 bacterium]